MDRGLSAIHVEKLGVFLSKAGVLVPKRQGLCTSLCVGPIEKPLLTHHTSVTQSGMQLSLHRQTLATLNIWKSSSRTGLP